MDFSKFADKKIYKNVNLKVGTHDCTLVKIDSDATKEYFDIKLISKTEDNREFTWRIFENNAVYWAAQVLQLSNTKEEGLDLESIVAKFIAQSDKGFKLYVSEFTQELDDGSKRIFINYDLIPRS